jgi:hypothetical protein
MVQKGIGFISAKLQRLESSAGLFLTSCILATVLMGIAMLYVQPKFTPVFHGEQFSLLSVNPLEFSVDNPMRYRILSPLLGHVLFLRGSCFFLFPLLAAWSLICASYFQHRKKNVEVIDAFFLTCFIAFSCVILLPLVAPGYTDVVTWLFIFMAFMHAGKIIPAAFYFALALLNHESSLALLPALALYNYEKNRTSVPALLLAFSLACLPHFFYRWYVHLHSDTLYALSFYLSESTVFFAVKKLVMYVPAAAFYAFKLWWVFPAGLIAWSLSRKKFLRPAILLLILAGAFSLVVIGYDYTRMLVIAFPAVILSYTWALEAFGAPEVRKLTFVLIAMNFIVLQYHFNYDGAQPMFPWALNKVSGILGTPLR